MKKAVTSVRVDVKLLADILHYTQKRGLVARSRSELILMGLEMLRQLLISNGKIEPVASISEALAALTLAGISLPQSLRDPKIMEEIMAEEEIAFEEEKSEMEKAALEFLKTLKKGGGK